MDKAKKFNVIKQLDSVFTLAQKWTDETPPVPKEMLDSISANMDSVEIYELNNNIDPQGIIFTSPKKSNLLILEQTATLKNLEKVSYQSYDVWRSVIRDKLILEFSLQPHPVKKWIFSIRRRSQE